MGCIVSKGTAETLLLELSEKKKKVEEYQNQLKPTDQALSNFMQTDVDMKEEMRINFINYKCLARYFPLEHSVHQNL